jgi:hypothetical protein
MKSPAELQSMSKNELISLVETMQKRYTPQARRYTLAAKPDLALTRLFTAIRVKLWDVTSKLAKDKPFTCDDVLAAAKAAGLKIESKNPDATVRSALNFFVRAQFLTLVTAKKSKLTVAA